MILNKKILIPLVLTLALSSCGGGSPSPSPTPETFTVTFNSNGGSNVPSQNIKSGEKATRPSDPKKDGYTFDNWYKDNSLTNVYDFSTPVITNLTLFAKWKNVYTVTFNSNGGSNVPSQNVISGDTVTRPTDPTKEGYAFENWYRDSLFENVYDFSTPVTINFTLFAKWNVNRYTVTFNTNGGSEIPSQIVNYGGKVNEPDQPTKRGYYFWNWFADSSFQIIFDFDTTYVTSNITIYVKWGLFEYDIVYNLHGGVNHADNPEKYTIEDEFIFADPTRVEHRFVNWTKDGSPITGISKGTIGKITIDANWNINQYQVNVYTNDEEKGTVEGGGTFDYGSDVTVTARAIRDCVFNGWYSDNEYTKLLSKNSEYLIIVPSGGISLYAKFWTKEEEEEWNKKHGVIPVISEDEKTLTYGLYPQTHVNDSILIAELEKIAPQTNEEYFIYNNEYYVKDTGHPDPDYYETPTFADGTTVVEGTTYYFKCEPITWNIKSSNDNYIIDCSNILYAHRFDDDSSVYANCELRTWLNGDFYNKAFSIKTTSSYIVPTDLNDVSVTGEKVWVGSKDQYDGEWYSSNLARQKKVSDFAICNFASMYPSEDYNRNGYYWTRSPYSKGSNGVWYVDGAGILGYTVYGFSDGCSPALTITI